MLRSKFAPILLAIASLLLTSSVAVGEPRIALLITNQAYSQPGAALSNTHRDGEILKSALERVGFKVWVAKDTANEGALLQAIGEHVQRLADAGPDAVGFFYYSGHGAADRPNGENFLIPTAVPLTHAAQLPLMAVRLERITSTLAAAGKMSFVVFDACRNVPLQRADKSPFKGFAPVREQNGLLIAFATDPGNVAIDQNLYAKTLAEELVQPDLEAAQIFRRVRLRVRAGTNQMQSPEYVDRRDDDFRFVVAAQALPNVISPPPVAAQPTRLSEAAEAWSIAKDSQSVSALEAFIQRFGDTFYGDLAKARVSELKQAVDRQAAEGAKKVADEAERARLEAQRQHLAILEMAEAAVKDARTKEVEDRKKVAVAPPLPSQPALTAEQYVARTKGAKLVPPGELILDQQKVACGKRPTVLDDTLDDYASSYPGFIILNTKLLAKVSLPVKLWAHAQACGHQYRGPDSETADCFAVQRGRRQAWLTPKGMDEVCQFISQAKGDSTHFPGPVRCERMRRCFDDQTVK